ncbi:hypothetical protein BW731_00245 [Vagococcus martis]|uniref:N-acetyltransferase domain-containing protein n=1 Tax=Vagococcus martis TaxID=1768210 RepID=A0A1V4DDW2_9ENTE|nr:GNAT family N-acetyltransferase [Vagococcus martis]OPF86734.1 hypothetical protein BW731_00245 [Vagococcus martis]
MIEFELIGIDYYLKTKDFDCKNLEINNYLKSNAYPDTIEFEASTSLVYKDGEVVAFFVTNDNFFIEIVDPETNNIIKIHAIEIQYLGVDCNHKKQGVGKAIIYHLIEVCREMNNRFIFLQSVKTSVGFYEKVGFQVIEESEQSFSMMMDLLNPEIIDSYYEQ